MAEHLIDSIRAEKDVAREKLDYMNEVDAMIKEMRVIFERALSGKTSSKETGDYEIPKFLKGETVKKELPKSVKDIRKQNLTKVKKDIA